MRWKFLDFLKPKCALCKKRDNHDNLCSVPRWGIYNKQISDRKFHGQCLIDISSNPKKYPSITVDMAILIFDEKIKAKETIDSARKANQIADVERFSKIEQHFKDVVTNNNKFFKNYKNKKGKEG